MKHRQIIWKRIKWWYWPIALLCLFFLNNFEAPKDTKSIAELLKYQLESRIDSAKIRFLRNSSNFELYNAGEYYAAIYHGDSLLAWNNNTFIPTINSVKKGLFQQGNSIYYGFELLDPKNKNQLLAAIPLKESPLIQNHNLKDKFLFPELQKIEFSSADGTTQQAKAHIVKIALKNGDLFFIQEAKNQVLFNTKSETSNWTIILLSIITLILYEIPLFAFCKRIKLVLGNWIALICFATIQILSTSLFFYFEFPSYWFDSVYFDSTIYASSDWLPTLGHFYALLLNLCLIILFAFYHLRHWIRSLVKYYYVLLVINLCIQILLLWMIQSIFIDANFNILNPNIALWNTVSLASLTILLFSAVIIFIILPITSFPRGIWDKNRKRIQLLNLVFILVCLFITYLKGELYYDNLWMHSAIHNLILLVAAELFFKLKKDHLQIFYVLFLSVVCIYIFSVLNHLKNQKETKHREYIARQLIKENDPTFKFLIPDIIAKIEADGELSERFHHILEKDGEQASLLPYLIQSYFQGYFNRYQIKFALSTPDYKGIIGTLKEGDLIRIDTLINTGFPLATTDKVYEIRSMQSFNGFIARIPLIDKNYQADVLYISFSTPTRMNRRLFPELLQSEKWIENINAIDLSYGIYDNKQLTQQYGSLSFPSTFNDQQPSYLETSENKNENFKIFTYFPNGKNEKGIILATHMGDLMNSLFLFIIFYTVCMLILLLLLNPVPMTHKYFPLSSRSLGNRIFFANSLLLLSLLIAIGIFGYYYFNRQAELNARESIIATSDNIMKGLQNSLLTEKTTLSESELNDRIQKLSSLFETDISLYNEQGKLLCSSQPSIYELGIIAPIINPEAKKEISNHPGISRIIEEHIGNLHFSSFYSSIKINSLEGGKSVIIGIPYYNRQKEKQESNSGILFKLIGIFALFFVLTTLFNYYLSSRISSSLKVLGNRLKGINLNNANTPIEWKEQDEVGLLIEQYNIMLEQLAISANALAKSERETAWREMARQVAHEIKNPLTPMKLSIQFLQRAIHDKRSDVESLTQKTAQTLVEQIDNLSLIANQFGQFAQISSNHLERIDLIAVINNSCNLYRRNEKCVCIEEYHEREIVNIRGNKTQLLSVFNNLLLNAIQAIPESQEGLIEVHTLTTSDHVQIMIKDNGLGIASDKLSKIFEPNFTTKNSGTGLGLAISKTIIQSCGGDIEARSTKNKGSEFIITLPLEN